MILVTGCAGFIGFHLSERLQSPVTGVDCFTDNYPRELKEANLSVLKKNKNFSFLEKDISNLQPSDIHSPSLIFHLAALPGVRPSWRDFPDYVHNNITATQNLLELARKADVQRFIYASSSSVYGNSLTYPVTESSPANPISPYGLTKLVGEQLCSIYAKTYGLSVCMPRFFTVYGPRQRPDMGIFKFFNAALNHQEIQIYGDGSQQRDFTFVSDIVDGLLLVADSKIKGPVNLGSGSPVSISHLLEKIGEISGVPLKTTHTEMQKGDVEKTFADISLARSLGFNPKTSLESGLRLQLEWMKSVL